MTQIHYHKGDLFKTEIKHIAHGVNCCGVMGSGVAKIVREISPTTYELYKAFCEEMGKQNLLGKIQLINSDDWDNAPYKIVNMFTQLDYGRNPLVKYVSYDAIWSCFNKLARLGTVKEIAIPKIGAGLANGDWTIIETVIAQAIKGYDLQVHVYEL